ncbi:MAG: hypothetical protein JWM21_1413 [Acidobacteria bacterium]|nr:hypothetical protein [Acidobacteriota bacterium]
MNRFPGRLSYSLILFVALFCFAANVRPVLAQDDKPTAADNKNDEINLDTQLYLIVGTNQDVADEKLPAVLDQVVRELKASLPFKNYRLTATLINRVKSDGRLSLRWIGGPLLASGAATNNTPSFNDFKIVSVKMFEDAQGRKMIRMDGFNFGSRIPVVTYNGVASNGTAPPVINYENTGLTTDISMREGQPVVVGTLNVGPSGDAIILVMTAKRAMK